MMFSEPTCEYMNDGDDDDDDSDDDGDDGDSEILLHWYRVDNHQLLY